MFETTESADQEHVDERAYKFFSYMYGRNGHHKGWDSTKEGLRPTATLGKSDRMRACAYCGRRALPIQKKQYSHRTGQDEYKNIGHCCVCKEAMDELDMVDQIDIITRQFNAALSKCNQAMPKTNPAVLLALMDKELEEKKKSLSFWTDDGRLPAHALADVGFNVKGSRYKNEDDD